METVEIRNGKKQPGGFNRLVTFVVFGIFLITNTTWASGSALQERQLIEDNYRTCVDTQLTSADLAEIKAFRKRFHQEVPAIQIASTQPGLGLTPYMSGLSQLLPTEIKPRLQSRYMMVIVERAIWEQVDQTITRRNKTFRNYMKMVHSAMLKQVPIDIDELKKTHSQLVSEFINHDLNRSDAMLGLKVPAALAMREPQRLTKLAFALNLMTESVASIQVENAKLAGDRWAYKKALAAQVSYGIVGTGAFIGTFFCGPAMVANGGRAAVAVGSRLLTGQSLGGLSVGALGGGGLELAIESISTMSSAYMRSNQYGTPFRCEFDRAHALSSPGRALATGIAMGGAAGLVGTAVAHSARLSRGLLLTTGFMIYAGVSYEAGYVGYDIYKMVELNLLAKDLENLQGVPESQKDVQEMLINALWAEYYAHARSLTQHGIKLAAVASLYYYWYPHGQLRDALVEGIERAKQLMGPSADTIPSVVTAGGSLIWTSASAARSAVAPNAVARTSLTNNARNFINKIVSNVQSTVAASEAIDWQIVSP